MIDINIEVVNSISLKYGKDSHNNAIIQRIAFASKYNVRLNQFLQDVRFKKITQFLGNYAVRVGEDEKDGLVVNHYLNNENSEYK